MIADATHPRQFFFAHRTEIESSQRLSRLRPIGWTRHAHINSRVRKNESVAIECSGHSLASRHSFGIQQLLPARRGKGDQPHRVPSGSEQRKYLTLSPLVHRVITHVHNTEVRI